jgi:hypothetical protein
MSKYCVTVDGAGVGTIHPNNCPSAPKAGEPTPYLYILGPAATEQDAQPYCATTDPVTNIQSFAQNACPSEGPNSFTFYSFGDASKVPSQPQLCFLDESTVNGTPITTSPKNVNACKLNLYMGYQNVTCNDTGCGDHGTCQSNICICSDNWSGGQCEIPPTGNAACTPDTPTTKSCGNQGSYGVCQSSVSSSAGIAGSGKCQCEFLTSQSGTFCEKACNANDPQACGGPLRGVCVDSYYQVFTNSNAVRNRCACLNGWSGFNCNIPPPGWECNDTDKTCTNITTMDSTTTIQTGLCNSGKCECYNYANDCSPSGSGSSTTDKADKADKAAKADLSDPTKKYGFTGEACQIPLAVKGTPCDSNTPCTLPDQSCISGVCTCTGVSPTPNDDIFTTIAASISAMLNDPKTYETVGLMIAIHNWKKLLQLAKFLSVKLLLPAFEKAILNRLAGAAAGKELGEKAFAALENLVGKSLAAKLMAKMSAAVILKTSITKLAENVTFLAFKAVFGSVLGSVSSIVDIAGIVGMVLDSADVAGLQEKMSQDTLDALMKKFSNAVNNVKEVQDAGMLYPQKLLSQDTFEFALLTSTQDSKDKLGTDIGNYIGHLTVNSNGDAIVPLFTTSVQQQQADEISAARKDTFLFTAAGYNIDVYNRLKQDWPIIVAATLVIIGILIGAGFGIKALVKKKKVLIKQ